MRARVLPLTALLLASAPAAAADSYVGFGDSITRGTNDPYNPPKIYDCAGNCSENSSAEHCGYVPRLEDELVGSQNVITEGLAGEATAEGLTRI